MKIVPFSNLLGQTIKSISEDKDQGETTTLKFNMESGNTFKLEHDQNCCEWVYLHDITGDIEDICNSLILQAEEVSDSSGDKLPNSDDSYTWTFYKLATIKGSVTLRWYGSSNGYYSEDVTCYEIEKSVELSNKESVS